MSKENVRNDAVLGAGVSPQSAVVGSENVSRETFVRENNAFSEAPAGVGASFDAVDTGVFTQNDANLVGSGLSGESVAASVGVSPQSAVVGNENVSRETFVRENEPEKHQVHHSYVWLGSIRIALAVLFASAISMGSSFIGVMAEGEASAPLTFAIFGGLGLLILLILAICVAYQVISYKHLYYVLEPDEFSLHSGIFSKKHVHVPYRRIQSVDQRASLFQRIFGVCSLSIDTAGGSANKAVNVPYVTKQQAESLRSELFARKYAASHAEQLARMQRSAGANGLGANGTGAAGAAGVAGLAGATGVAGVAGAAGAAGAGAGFETQNVSRETFVRENVLDVPAEIWEELGGVFAHQGAMPIGEIPVSYECGLSNKELVFTGMTSNAAFVLIVLGTIATIAEVASLLVGFLPVAGDQMLQAIVMEYAVQAAVMGVLSIVGLFVTLWVVSVLMTCISYGGFRARRRGSRVEVERGLLQHQFQGVEVDRIQSISIKQSFIRRLMGYCELSLGKIDAANEGDSNNQGNSLQEGLVIHPFAKLTDVPEILAGLVPEFQDVPTESVPVAPVAMRRAIIRECILRSFGFWLAVATALCQVAVHLSIPSDAVFEMASLQVSVLSALDSAALVLYVIAILLIAISAVDARYWFRESSFAVNERFLQMNIGGLSRQTVSFPRNKLQFGYVKTNPFQRRAHTATLYARTAAGVGGTTTKLIDVREEDAAVWLKWLHPFCASTRIGSPATAAPTPASALSAAVAPASPAPASATVSQSASATAQNVSRETFVCKNDGNSAAEAPDSDTADER